jgi:hypothetical protein
VPSFPTSVFSPGTKSAGNVIQPSHVNDLQDEVVAIESGYLNGTAPLNSSNSTVANLQVTGGSTFAVRPTFTPPDAAKVFLVAPASLASSVASTVSFLAQSYLINSSVHSTTTNPERLIPQSTGVYRFTAQCRVSQPSANNQVQLRIEDSSNAAIAAQDVTQLSAIGALATINVSGTKRFDAVGGYAKVVFTNVAVASTVTLSSGIENTWFSMEKL